MRYAIFVIIALSLLVMGCSAVPDDEADLPVATEDSPAETVANEPGDTPAPVTDLGEEASVDDVDAALSDVDLDDW